MIIMIWMLEPHPFSFAAYAEVVFVLFHKHMMQELESPLSRRAFHRLWTNMEGIIMSLSPSQHPAGRMTGRMIRIREFIIAGSAALPQGARAFSDCCFIVICRTHMSPSQHPLDV